MVDLVGNFGDHHALHVLQRQIENHLAVLMQGLLPIGIHHEMAEDDIQVAVVHFGQLCPDRILQWFNQSTERRLDDHQLAILSARRAAHIVIPLLLDLLSRAGIDFNVYRFP